MWREITTPYGYSEWMTESATYSGFERGATAQKEPSTRMGKIALFGCLSFALFKT